MPIDPSAVLELARDLVPLLRAALTRWRVGPDRSTALLEAGDGDFETYLAAAIGELRLDVRELVERLNEDRERQRVMLNLCAEHRREAMRGRRAMLGDAGVAVIVSPLETRDVARVERALRVLDPEDLGLLRELRLGGVKEDLLERYEAHGDRVGNRSLGPRRVGILRNGHLGGSNLIAAGCVAIVSHVRKPKKGPAPFPTSLGVVVRDGGELEVEEAVEILPVGELVLRFMRLGAVAGYPEGEPSADAKRQ